MMNFGMREAMELFDMLRDSACMIDHYTDYISHCQDPQLRQLLEGQQRRMVENYHQKAGVMQSHGLDMTNVPRFQSTVGGQQPSGAFGVTGSQGAGPIPGMQGAQGMAGMAGTMAGTGMSGQSNIQFGMQQPGQQAQQYQQQSSRTLNDRTIAQGALLFHKCGASRATQAALESAEPHLRNLAANSARSCIDMAYELFRYMEQRGFYQLPEVPRHFVNHAQATGGQVYPGMQQGYQAGSPGGMPGQLS